MPEAAAIQAAEATLRRYLARLDGDEAGEPIDLFSDDVAFAVNLPAAGFGGGLGDLRDYLACRDTESRRRHRVVHVSSHGNDVVLRGESRDGDTVLGTFLIAAETDDRGLLRRFLATFSPGLTFSTTDTRD